MRAALLTVAFASLAPFSTAQAPCAPTLAPSMGYAGLYAAQMVAFDDGSGPALYLPGNVYGTSTPQIYKWNGSALTPVFGTAPCHQGLLAVHDDGTGPALYAAGQAWPLQSTYGVWKWSGASWVQQGGSFYPSVLALGSWVDPMTGQRKLVAGGQFLTIGGVPMQHLAAWDGATWSSVGGPGVPNAFVANLAFEPTGPLAGLYASGFFTTIGGVAVPSKVARFDGTTWTALGTGFGDYGRLHLFDDGAGRALYVGGRQTLPGGGLTQLLARWNGTSWAAVGAPIGLAGIQAFETFDDGAGERLYLSGYAPNQLTPANVQRWNGTSWGVVAEMNGGGNDLSVFDAGSGAELHVAGGFSSTNGRVVHGFARWNGTALEPLVEGGGLTGNVWSLTGHDDGTGPAVYAAGELFHAGGQGSYGVARWREDHWESVGGAFVYTPWAVASLDLGSGLELYATSSVGPWPGPQYGVSRWNGSEWIPVGTNLGASRLRALVVHDDGTGKKLHAGGLLQIDGGATVHGVARFDGTRWERVGGAFDDEVFTLTSHGSGTSAKLYAGGYFLTNHGAAMAYAARFDGTDWAPFATPLNGAVYSFARYDDEQGRGTELYVGGLFHGALQRVARFDGSNWQALGLGLTNDVYALSVHDDGTGQGTQLVAGGNFQLARWNGTSWSTSGPSIDRDVLALASLDGGNGDGRELWIGGNFFFVGGQPALRVTRESACTTPGSAFCGADGLDPSVTIACPCGNAGASGHGCANSASGAGGALVAEGRTSPDTVALQASALPPTAPCIFLKGDARLAGGALFGDGIRCVDGALIRLGVVIASGGSARFPGPGQPLVSVRGQTPVGSGRSGYYQVHYRNAAAGFCPPAVFNVTNAWRIVW